MLLERENVSIKYNTQQHRRFERGLYLKDIIIIKRTKKNYNIFG